MFAEINDFVFLSWNVLWNFEKEINIFFSGKLEMDSFAYIFQRRQKRVNKKYILLFWRTKYITEKFKEKAFWWETGD